MDKLYYKDIDLSKRDYEIIDNKIKYLPLNIFIYKKDAIDMLSKEYKYYKEILKNKWTYKTKKDYEIFSSKSYNILRLKNILKRGLIYKDYIIRFNKNERPNKNNHSEILFYLSIDGYIPHIDTLEII